MDGGGHRGHQRWRPLPCARWYSTNTPIDVEECSAACNVLQPKQPGSRSVEFLWISFTVASHHPHVIPQAVQEVSDILIQVWEETPPPGDSSGSEYGSRGYAHHWNLHNLKSAKAGQIFYFPFNFHYDSIHQVGWWFMLPLNILTFVCSSMKCLLI